MLEETRAAAGPADALDAGQILRSADDVREALARAVFQPSPDDPVIGAVGLESEVFPMHLDERGGPGPRLGLREIEALIDGVGGTEREASGDRRPSWRRGRCRITEEPGAQLELITAPEPTTAAALEALQELTEAVEGRAEEAGVALAGGGLDLWHDHRRLPLQLEVPRYQAMSEYFERRGTDGIVLMCASCSLQVNLDLGPPQVAADRWLVSNLVAPFVVASFAASPTNEAVNGRSRAWQRLDRTRTGLPDLVASTDPVAHVADDVLRADVMFVQRDGRAHAGQPGWRFSDWVAHGHPTHGSPTMADLDLHRTTLFGEVHLRGFIEIRGVDQLPRRWRAAPVVLLAGLLYDLAALTAVKSLLWPLRHTVGRLLVQASKHGLRDPAVGPIAQEVWRHALAGAERLDGHVGPQALEIATDYVERYIRGCRHPADELAAALREGPAAALDWAR